jgi:hypothetical protein
MNIKPETRRLLAEMPRTNYGKAVEEYLTEAMKELRDVVNATSWDDTLARQHSVKFLEDLLSLMREPKTPTSSKTRYD